MFKMSPYRSQQEGYNQFRQAYVVFYPIFSECYSTEVNDVILSLLLHFIDKIHSFNSNSYIK